MRFATCPLTRTLIFATAFAEILCRCRKGFAVACPRMIPFLVKTFLPVAAVSTATSISLVLRLRPAGLFACASVGVFTLCPGFSALFFQMFTPTHFIYDHVWHTFPLKGLNLLLISSYCMNLKLRSAAIRLPCARQLAALSIVGGLVLTERHKTVSSAVDDLRLRQGAAGGQGSGGSHLIGIG